MQCLICTDVALFWFHSSTGLATCFNVNVKNHAFDTPMHGFHEELGKCSDVVSLS